DDKRHLLCARVGAGACARVPGGYRERECAGLGRRAAQEAGAGQRDAGGQGAAGDREMAKWRGAAGAGNLLRVGGGGRRRGERGGSWAGLNAMVGELMVSV